MATTLDLIDDLRAAVEEARSIGPSASAYELTNLLEQACDELDRLNEKAAELEDALSAVKDELADTKDAVALAQAAEGSSARLQELEAPVEALIDCLRQLRRALDPSETSEAVPTVRVF